MKMLAANPNCVNFYPLKQTARSVYTLMKENGFDL